MKALLWIAGIGALGAGIWWLCRNREAAQAANAANAVATPQTQTGGNSIFNEPDMEPMATLAAAAQTVLG